MSTASNPPFAPAPLTATNNYVRTANGGTLAECSTRENAILYAAAPAMYDALREIARGDSDASEAVREIARAALPKFD